jgi:antitoxin component YwqK of YwqJK toxin-antitoxin module
MPASTNRLLVAAFAGLAGFAQAGTVVPGGPDRIIQVFHEDGTLASQTTFRDGRKVGRHVAYWPDGARRVETTYDGDVIAGVYRTWYPSGQLAELKHYAQGREDGFQQAWTERGELFLNVEVRNGRPYGLINSKPCLPVQGAM